MPSYETCCCVSARLLRIVVEQPDAVHGSHLYSISLQRSSRQSLLSPPNPTKDCMFPKKHRFKIIILNLDFKYLSLPKHYRFTFLLWSLTDAKMCILYKLFFLFVKFQTSYTIQSPRYVNSNALCCSPSELLLARRSLGPIFCTLFHCSISFFLRQILSYLV